MNWPGLLTFPGDYAKVNQEGNRSISAVPGGVLVECDDPGSRIQQHRSH